jgi:type IV secretory pathway TraG/TraD family ATPase VirD4
LTLVDDIRSITNVLVVDDGDAKAAHWNNSARTLLTGIILFTLTRAPDERNLITVCELLPLTYAPLVKDAKQAAAKAGRR